MSFFDFLKGNKKSRRRGGRRAEVAGNRLAADRTRQMPLPPAPLHPNPGTPAASPPENRTVVRPAPIAQLPQSPSMAQPTASQRPASAAYPPPQHADSGQTQYIETSPTGGGDVVGVLVVTDGELKGQLFGVSDGENRIGRSMESEIELNSLKVSRDHALLIHQDGTFVIKPISEKNPTFLNEIRTAGDELGDGDTIRVGLTTLKFRSI